MRVDSGDPVPVREMVGVAGQVISLVPATGVVHLQFVRFAGCPICNLHLRRFAGRASELASAGIVEIVVFHSSAEELMKYEAELPFPAVPDPDKRLYGLFGVETSPRAVADPRVWGDAVWGLVTDARRARKTGAPMPPARPRHGEFGLPADFLIGREGVIIAAKRGLHAADQWDVDDVLRLARYGPNELHDN